MTIQQYRAILYEAFREQYFEGIAHFYINFYLLYIHLSHEKNPEQQALLDGNNPHQYPDGREQDGLNHLVCKVRKKISYEQDNYEKTAKLPSLMLSLKEV